MELKTKKSVIKPVRGEVWVLHDGAEVTVLEKGGGAFRVLNSKGTISVVYPGEFAHKL